MDIRCDRRSASWRFPKGVALCEGQERDNRECKNERNEAVGSSSTLECNNADPASQTVGSLGSVSHSKRGLTCKPDLSEIAISEFKAMESRASRGTRRREAPAMRGEPLLYGDDNLTEQQRHTATDFLSRLG
jgi:hypothetical protein